MNPMLGATALALGWGGAGGYAIAYSCRFNDDDGPTLTRSIGTDGNKRRWTWSGWVKLANLGIVGRSLMGAGTTSGAQFDLFFDAADSLQVIQYNGSYALQKVTAAKFRDPTSWLHVVLAYDSDNATPEDRVILHVNGARVTNWSVNTLPAINLDSYVNEADLTQRIGHYYTSNFLDGLLAEVHFVDGQSLAATAFGALDADGHWRPRLYVGTYGAKGYRLDFADGGNLGADVSGAGNSYTPAGLTASDQSIDSPTDNHCCFSSVNTYNSPTLRDGSLRVTSSSTTSRHAVGTQALASKVYVEFACVAPGIAGVNAYFGLSSKHFAPDVTTGYLGDNTNAWSVGSSGTGGTVYLSHNGVQTQPTGNPGLAANDVIMLAVDPAAGKWWAGKNGAWFNGGDPAAGTGALHTNLPATLWLVSQSYNGAEMELNAGQRAFAHAPPAGFKGLSTAGLPAPPIKRPARWFAPRLHAGNGGTRTINDLLFAPDLAWLKARDAATGHRVVDAVRGAGTSLATETTAAEASEATGLASFDANGVTLGADADYNASAVNFRAWFWKKGAVPGLDIVTYAGDDTANRDIAHALGAPPAFAIVKRRDGAGDWWFWHRSMTGQAYFQALNGTAAESAANAPWGSGAFGAATFRVTNNGTNNANAAGASYVAYLFAEVPGYSAFTSFLGNGAADGPVCHLGFRPAFVYVRQSVGAGSYNDNIYDRARNPMNPMTNYLSAHAASAEDFTVDGEIDALAMGFKVRVSTGDINTSGNRHIVVAFAEAPFKLALAT